MGDIDFEWILLITVVNIYQTCVQSFEFQNRFIIELEHFDIQLSHAFLDSVNLFIYIFFFTLDLKPKSRQ